MYSFPDELPNPENMYMPYSRPFKPETDIPDTGLALPKAGYKKTIRVGTYPGLFPSAYSNANCIHFMTMKDMLRVQALFAARQFYTARCLEHPALQSDPVVVAASGTKGNRELHDGLLLELDHLDALVKLTTVGEVRAPYWNLDPKSCAARQVTNDATDDLRKYAPWLGQHSRVAAFFHDQILDANDCIREARLHAQDFTAARARFYEAAAADMLAGQRLRSNVSVFPVKLPNPMLPDLPPSLYCLLTMLCADTPPPPVIVTFPGLFPDDNEEQTEEEWTAEDCPPLLKMEDRLLLQALFAARQFFTAQCLKHPVLKDDPVVTMAASAKSTLMRSELDILDAHMYLTRHADVREVRDAVSVDLWIYAPWLELPTGIESLYTRIRDAHAALLEARALTREFVDTRARFYEEANPKKRKHV